MAAPQKKTRIRTPAQRRRENRRRRNQRLDAKNAGKVETEWKGAAPVPETNLPALTGDDVRSIVQMELARASQVRAIAPGRNDHDGVKAPALDGEVARLSGRVSSTEDECGPAREVGALESALNKLGNLIDITLRSRSLTDVSIVRLVGHSVPTATEGKANNTKAPDSQLHLIHALLDRLSDESLSLESELRFVFKNL